MQTSIFLMGQKIPITTRNRIIWLKMPYGIYIRSNSVFRDCYIVFNQIHLKLSENWSQHFSPKTQWFTEFSVKILSIFAIFAVFLQNLERILRKWNIFIIFMPGCRFLINYSYLAIHLLLQIWGGKNCIHWVFSESLSF